MFVGRTHPSLVPNTVRAFVSIVGISYGYRPGPRLCNQREGHRSVVYRFGFRGLRSSAERRACSRRMSCRTTFASETPSISASSVSICRSVSSMRIMNRSVFGSGATDRNVQRMDTLGNATMGERA